MPRLKKGYTYLKRDDPRYPLPGTVGYPGYVELTPHDNEGFESTVDVIYHAPIVDKDGQAWVTCGPYGPVKYWINGRRTTKAKFIELAEKENSLC